MPVSASKKKKKEEASGVTTRSRAAKGKKAEASLTYYTDLKDPSSSTSANGNKSTGGIKVISSKRLKNDPRIYEDLKAKFEKIDRERIEAENKRDNNQEIDDDNHRSDLKSNSVYFVIHLNVFIYATCFFVQVGTLPYLATKLGADTATFGQLQTVFAVAQLLGGPIYGRIGDVLGEKLTLIVAFASAALTYFLMGVSYSLPLLFISRIPSVFMHTMQGSQMIVTYLSNEDDRASGLARLGFSYGLGMVTGPTLGGFVTKNFGERNAALLASSGMVLSLILVLFFIPTIPKRRSQHKQKQNLMFNLKKLIVPLFAPGTRLLLLIKLICGIPIGVIQSMFTVVAIERYGLPPEQNGMMLSYIGAISLFMQGIGVSALTKRLSDKMLLKFSAISLAIAYYAFMVVDQVFDFMLLLFPLTCSLCLVNSILTSAITKSVSKDETGTILGLNMAVHSTIRSVSPTLGGYLMQSYGFQSLGLLGVVCNLLTLILISYRG